MRNRARRRLLEAFSQLQADRPNLVPPGDYLISVYDSQFEYKRGLEWLSSGLERLRVTGNLENPKGR